MVFYSLAMAGSETVDSVVRTTKDTIVLLLDRSMHIV